MTSERLRNLRVLLEPGHSGAFNMRRDTELLEAQGNHGPVLRLYSWNPPAISIGHMQEASTLLDLEACRRDGIDVVQRPTGGRAILHWQEVTYALIASLQDQCFSPSLRSAHQVIGECLAGALLQLGIKAEFSRPTPDPKRRLLRSPCFVSAGRAELLVEGRKLIGSAQRRTSRAFLQHGSLLVGPAHARLIDYLHDTKTDLELARTMQQRLHRDTTHLQKILGRDPGFALLAHALIRSFSERLGLVPCFESCAVFESSTM